MKKENDEQLKKLSPARANRRSHMETEIVKPYPRPTGMQEQSDDKKIERLLADLQRLKRKHDAQMQASAAKPIATPFVSRSTRLSTDAYRSMLLFYKAQPDDPLLNRLVSWFDPPYVHVEIRFEDGMASSIFAGETVFFRQRTFANKHRLCVALSRARERLVIIGNGNTLRTIPALQYVQSIALARCV
ncbi:hypothetical protein GUITHDRAFT_146908 [Guillardia theta CCMP2712]|uniref:Uncharacterized protein n=1 Tax=Guillardia theta (strain CCMP2712) TaxID=905079 RepID=L1IFB3_GUITC|nr:hypothetical protein GUITHDRAFT_146908 [Guillardia theta CCMP2712]EKX34918.1 hypothetical protein GUITHDRAFT_146908 [Guillardia theta CCMP2712]|eukprot:XP_005821898.1 hypothetical protein GUITHDRAFT_146908 [Guillardia theta CCMP2712]